MLNIYEKSIIAKFVCINNVEFELSKLFVCLNQIIKTKEDNPLREYEIYYVDEMNKLVDIGIVNININSGMTAVYYMKDERTINNLLEDLYKVTE